MEGCFGISTVPLFLKQNLQRSANGSQKIGPSSTTDLLRLKASGKSTRETSMLYAAARGKFGWDLGLQVHKTAQPGRNFFGMLNSVYSRKLPQAMSGSHLRKKLCFQVAIINNHNFLISDHHDSWVANCCGTHGRRCVRTQDSSYDLFTTLW